MASPASIPPTPDSSSPRQRHRQRRRYRLPDQGKKRQNTKRAANLRVLIVVGVLLVALLVTLAVIAFHLIPAAESAE